MFAVNLINNKVVDNLFIFLVSNFQGNRPNGFGVMAVRSWSPKMLTLCNFCIDIGSLPVFTRIEVASDFGD